MSTFKVDKLYWGVNSQEWSFSKCWIQHDSIANTIGQDYNVSSVTDAAVGIKRYNFDDSFRTTHYCVGFCINEGSWNSDLGAFIMGPATPYLTYPTLTTSFTGQISNQNADSFADAKDVNVVMTEWGGA